MTTWAWFENGKKKTYDDGTELDLFDASWGEVLRELAKK